jgi:hypothetical protein
MPLNQEAKDSQRAAFENAQARAIETATKKAQEQIRKILLALEHDTMLSIESVAVDTRNFAQLDTEIFLTKRQRQ